MDEQRSPDWSELPQELLELVVTKLHFIDVLRFKGVCSSFRLAAKVRSSVVAPLLMHQSTNYRYYDEFLLKFPKEVRFLSPQDMNTVIYSPQGENCLERLLDKGCCVGSSHGWLVVLDKEANPYLLNPFSGAEIELPKKETLPGIIYRGDIRVKYDGCVHKLYCFKIGGAGNISVPTIQKAILTANPSYADDYKVFIICGGFPTSIAFCCPGDRTWRRLRSLENFKDVAFHNGRLYAIQHDIVPPSFFFSTEIHIWDLSSTIKVPQECGCIVISDIIEQVWQKINCFIERYYLVSSSEDVFVVLRFIRDRTVEFEIYKLEREHGKEFVCMESLPSQAMFLGGNHGMVISVQDYDNKVNENAIYFTYDYENVYLDYRNYDIGVYSLENGRVSLLCDVPKQPVPFWVFPGQKYVELSVFRTDK